MAFKEVVGYWAEWNLQQHVGKIWVKTDDDMVTVFTRQLQTSLETPAEGEAQSHTPRARHRRAR